VTLAGTLGTSSGGTGSTSTTYCSLTTNVTNTLPVANGCTGTSTAFTTGSVVFAGASGTYSQDNANFFWDDTNNRLGIGTASPDVKLTIAGGGGAAIKILDGGDIQINNAANTGSAVIYCDTDLVLNVTGGIITTGTISNTNAAVGDLGTYAWLAYAAASTATIVAGTNYAGSGLRYFGYTGTSTGAASGGTLPATTPSGTWKAMGNVNTATNLIKHTLYLRVA
jgi:hypothetical protein